MALQLTGRARLLVLLIAALVLAGLALLFRALGRRVNVAPVALNQTTASPTPLPVATASISPIVDLSPTPTTSPVLTPGPPPAEESPASQSVTADPLGSSFVGTLKLIIPVVGVRPDQLLDTFTDARSEGRAHDAIDIPAAAGTPVVAVADGEIVRLFQSERGGTTIYQLSTDKKLVFYYGHLQRYADGLTAGQFVKQGQVIAYVGDTGNAGAGNFHLHFSIAVLADPKRYWEGTNINPYPLLRK